MLRRKWLKKMDYHKNISVYLEGNPKAKYFLVPIEWDDRDIIYAMIQAFEEFSETKTCVDSILNSFYEGESERYRIRQDSDVSNSIEEWSGWFILLNYMPDSFFESVGIEVLVEQPGDIHLVKIAAEEEIFMSLNGVGSNYERIRAWTEKSTEDLTPNLNMRTSKKIKNYEIREIWMKTNSTESRISVSPDLLQDTNGYNKTNELKEME